MVAIANATGSVVAELGTDPNQPLAFDGDGVRGWEDDLIAYNWARSLTGDGPRRLVLDAMTKSAVRAMDTVTAIMARPEWGERHIERFVVSGVSKRGWTTWLAAAVDERVVGIAPIVFDVLNMEASIRHHFAAYGTSRRQLPTSPCTASCRVSARRRSRSCCESPIRTHTGIT